MNSHQKELLVVRTLSLLVLLTCLSINYSISTSTNSMSATRKSKTISPPPPTTRSRGTTKRLRQFKVCMPTQSTVRAKKKSCLLRPDTGPCRADILSWYYDAKEHNCFRFFWGGCQGNGNRFDDFHECLNYCYVNSSMATGHVPHFCSLAFEYGDCFGLFYRYAFDPIVKNCKRRMYSGCGGNQNNFETHQECMATCISKPNNTMKRSETTYTTCIPFTIPGIQ